MTLVRTYFPDNLQDVIPIDDWIDILSYFLHLVENAGWFEIDWNNLNDLHRCAMEEGWDEDDDGEEIEPTGLSYLSEYLYYIPVRCFGIEREWYDELFEYPPLHLLSALVEVNGYGLPDGYEFLDDFGAWNDDGKLVAKERLAGLDTSTLPEPLCWLPEMAAYVCGETGNEIMDRHVAFMDIFDLDGGGYWAWAGDLDYVRRIWQEAQPIRERLKRFLEWAEGEEEMKMITSIVTGRNYE